MAGLAMRDAEIAELRAGDWVVVDRSVDAAGGRPAYACRWLVEVAELHFWSSWDGWSLVVVTPPPGRRLTDFHVGMTGVGMRTTLTRADRPLDGRPRLLDGP